MADPRSAPPPNVYDEMHASADFAELRRRYRAFAIPWTIAFLAWYMLYVICSNWAPGLMNYYLIGNINVALIFGLLQFASTFLIAWLYSRHASRELDPIAVRLNDRYDAERPR